LIRQFHPHACPLPKVYDTAVTPETGRAPSTGNGGHTLDNIHNVLVMFAGQEVAG